MKNNIKEYDVVIVGAGVTGTAVLHLLTAYTNLKKIALIERYSGPAMVSSKATNNSQTLHFGDIETNYSVEKARSVKVAAEMVVSYVKRLKDKNGVYRVMPKMVLAVGENEVAELEKRHSEFKELFPTLKKLGADQIRKVEPKVMEVRDPEQPVLALYQEEGYAMNFGKLSESFIESAVQKMPEAIDIIYDTPLCSLKRMGDGYLLRTPNEKMRAKTIVIAAGAYSLTLAHSLGYGCDLTLIPVAGNFYEAPNMLNGKVYRVQHKKLPFAAIHGDPEVTDLSRMRFGPIAKAVPILEPRKLRTMIDFFKVFRIDWDAIMSVIKINTDPVILKFIAINFFYDWPIIGKPLFLKLAKKIIPTLKASDLTYGKYLGGVRPQVVNRKKREMQLGEAKILGENIIFNITPSPGASVCLKNAEKDMRKIVEFLGTSYQIDEESFSRDFQN